MRPSVLFIPGLPGLFVALVLAGGCRLSKGVSGVGDPAGEAGAGAQDGADRRRELTLDNGLRVVLEVNHTSPVVAMQAWVGVGSADGPAETAGAAHLFEHLLFQGSRRARGTTKPGAATIAREIEAAGGDFDAWTSFDETVYRLTLASRYLDTGVDILADALIDPAFEAAELARARNVLLEEIEQAGRAPERAASQALFSAAYRTHPYGRSVVGSDATVAALTREQVVAFFRRYYVARNVTLVIVGDFDAGRAEAKIAAAFGPMRRGDAPAARPSEPAQVAPRTAVVGLPREAQQAQLLMSFHTPAIAHEDVPALDLVAAILGQGEGARLEVQLGRNRQPVTGARAYMFTSRDGGMLVAAAAMSPGRVEESARAILDEALRLGRQPVSAGELARARAILERSIARDGETAEGYARRLGFFASVAGDATIGERYLERVRRVTPEEIKAVAARYLRAANLTTAVAVPDGDVAGPGAKSASTAAKLAPLLDAVAAGAEARADRRAAMATAPSTPVRPPAAAVAAGDRVARVVLPSGVRVLVLRDASVPIVSLQAVWPGGLRYEDARSNGISNLLAAVLPRGARGRGADGLGTEPAGTAGEVAGFAGRNSLGLRAEGPSAQWEGALERLADCIRNPRLADEDLERERRIILDDIRAHEGDGDGDLGHAAFRLFQSTLWKKHPYRLEVLGTAESLAALTRRKLVDHYRRYYPISALTIAVVGDVDAERVFAKLQTLLGDVPSGTPPAAAPAAAPPVVVEPARAEPAEVFQLLPREQAHVVLGYPGTTLQDADRFPLDVLSQILSGQGGRLPVELREKRPLAYQVSASSVQGIDPGYFAVYLACSPANLDQGVLAIRAELARVAADGVTADEVARARNHLAGAHALALQRRSALAGAIALGEAYGQGWSAYRRYGDDIQKVTADDVKRVARKYLDSRREVVAVVRPQDPASPAAHAGAGGERKPGAAGRAHRQGAGDRARPDPLGDRVAGCTSCSWEVQLEDTFCPRCGAPVIDPLIGAVVGERYRIVSRIGVGGMGAVYRAEHTMMRRDLAIKVLLSELGGREEFARRFEREAESASRLTHPNIITVTDFGRTPDGALFIAMEFLAGDSLTSVISQGPLPRPRALAIIRQMLRALDHAHAAGVVHRDLKPDNIMLVERDGQRDVVKILDFGIAKVTEPASGGEALTQAGVIFGTPEYLSPEQAVGEPVDARADLYAAGVILYEMLVGRRPFESDDKVKIISMHLSHAPPRMRDVNAMVEVPPALEQVVLQAMEKHRENRFASAVAFLQALEDSELASNPSLPLEMGETLPHVAPSRPSQRGPRVPARTAAALALAVALSAGGVLAVRGRSHRGKGKEMNVAVLKTPPPRPAPPAPDLAVRIKKIEAQLEDGNTVAARLALEEELSQRPKDARIHYMLGRVAFAENRRADGMTSYREAIQLDPGFRGDPVLLAHVDSALAEPRNAAAALDLIVDQIGAPAADLLEKIANEGSDLPRRQRAVAALKEMGKGDRVDQLGLLQLELKKAATCEERKDLVEELRQLGDRRALPALRALRPRGLNRLMSRLGGGPGTACMKKELAAAIKELEGKKS